MTAAQKLIEYYEKELVIQGSRKTAFEFTCQKWKDIHGFDPPITSYQSFKKMLTYYYKKQRQPVKRMLK